MTVVVALGFALFDVVVPDPPLPAPLPCPLCLLAMSVYFTCKQIAVPALRSEVCLLEACPQAAGRGGTCLEHALLALEAYVAWV